MSFVMGLFPSCHKAKETWFLTYSFFSTQKPCTSRPYCTLIFLGRTLWISNVLTFLSFLRGLHFLLCNKRPVCRKTDWVFISSSFFLKKQFRKFEKQVRYLFLPYILSVTRPVIPTVEFLYFGHALHWPTYLHYVLLSYMIVFFPKKQFRKFSKSDTYLLLPYILSVARVDTNYRV